MKCLKPVLLFPRGKAEVIQKYPHGLEVPCGKCLSCRIQIRRQWTLRLLHESSYYEHSIFVTLTYSDIHVKFSPGSVFPTLSKRDLQLFIKRLRKSLGDRKIKYYACGEYGDLSERPHYHLIIFGLSLSKIDKNYIIDNWPYCDWSVPTIRKNSFGMAETHSIQYVAQYIDKKLSGEEADIEYVQKKREPVFKISSLGLGKQFAKDNEQQMKNLGYCTARGQKYSIPRYYINILGLDVDKVKLNAEINEAELIENLTGLNSSKIGYYITQKPSDVVNLSAGIKESCIQNERNLTAKIAMKTKVI